MICLRRCLRVIRRLVVVLPLATSHKKALLIRQHRNKTNYKICRRLIIHCRDHPTQRPQQMLNDLSHRRYYRWLPINEAKNGTYAHPLHSVIASCWNNNIKLGLPGADQEELLTLYPPPENCLFFDPPLQNVELDCLMTGKICKRDDEIMTRQKILAAGLAAAGELINPLLELDQPDSAKLTPLLNVGRILTDSIHELSVVRRKLGLLLLYPSMRDPIAKVKIGEFLFDATLGETVKRTKALELSTAKLKGTKPQKPPKNASGPPRRYQAYAPLTSQGRYNKKRPSQNYQGKTPHNSYNNSNTKEFNDSR